MRPSSIAQGLKSWASKLHPQLPLTTQESSRLLNALTSAFRQKLDEAHPGSTSSDEKQIISSKAVAKSASAFHSSAAHADKHLESVLTNPLLGGRVLDYGTAKVELTKNPHRDPIELLEDYYAKGAASVAIAELCLGHFRHSVERLPQSKQQASIQEMQAGRRVFKWFLDSNLYDSKSYIDNLQFVDHLVFFLVKEGREENVWSWVKIDIPDTDGELPNVVGSLERIERKTKLYEYRWRGRLLRALIQAKLGPMDRSGVGPGPDQIHAAFDTVFRVCDLKASGLRKSDHLRWIPMAPISTLFCRLLTKRPHIIRSGLDVARFERYCDSMPVICDNAPQLYLDFERAKLRLVHPQGRQPAEAFACFKELFSDNPSDGALYLLPSIRTSGSNATIHNWWSFATATVYALRLQGSSADADWLQARCIREFPRQAPNFDAVMQRYRREDMGRGARLDHLAPETQDQTRIPFPTFA